MRRSVGRGEAESKRSIHANGSSLKGLPYDTARLAPYYTMFANRQCSLSLIRQDWRWNEKWCARSKAVHERR